MPYVAAAPVTWEALGTITGVYDPFFNLTGISAGTPWTLDFTFDPGAPGTHHEFCSSPTYGYHHAISNTIFQLGGFTYANSAGDIYTNADLPYIGCGTSFGGPGLVQFQWLGGWTGGAGGPDLNQAVVLASYNDVNAVDGSLPSIPVHGPPGSLDGEFRADFGGICIGCDAQFFSLFFDPQPVPEPASLLLFGTGMVFIVRTIRRRDRQRPPSLRGLHTAE